MISHKVYDDVAEKNFMAQYRRWNDYNLELLKQSFDNSENDIEMIIIHQDTVQYF